MLRSHYAPLTCFIFFLALPWEKTHTSLNRTTTSGPFPLKRLVVTSASGKSLAVQISVINGRVITGRAYTLQRD